MSEVRVELNDGTTERLLVLDGNITREYMKQSHIEVDVIRDEWFSLVNDVDKINDEFYLERNGVDVFGGRLVSSTNQKSSVRLEIGSFEEDALDAEPTGDTEEFVEIGRAHV